MREPVASLHHANHKNEAGEAREILIAKPLVFANYFSDADKATHVVSTGGAIIPVIESPTFVAGICFDINKTQTDQQGELL